ncbi:hypothetical protein PSQ19_14665 [Devosia algicola]|uniref:Uncharacterized protein n=1 Tax=Devosia algicola TaxID=3026418 RepID=A0ABY7YKU1_9HYPH|nr:hypothetical protein [Devosia algicola]WDR01928.1 hypothetical protein PSQ19_14665 [Devosia algicola]
MAHPCSTVSRRQITPLYRSPARKAVTSLTFALAFAPINALNGVEVEVLLEAGDLAVPIATTGTRIEMDDSFILEGRIALDAKLTDLLTAGGTLSVFVEDGAEEFPLGGAREAATSLIQTCVGNSASVPPSGTKLCNLAAWIMEEAPVDLALRTGPGPGYPVVATVPGPYTDGAEIYFPEVTITGSRDGWFQITKIVTDLYGGLDTDPITNFAGEGWLPGNVLRLWVQSAQLRTGPSADAPIAFTLDDSGSAADIFRVDNLHQCEDDWIEVDGTASSKRLRGWTNQSCANQVTTCS